MAKDNPSGALNPLALSGVDLCTMLLRAGVEHLTPSAIGKWVQDGCPRNPDKTYNALKVLAWHVNERAKIPHRPPAETDEMEKAKLSVLQERKLTLRQNRLERKGQLVEKEVIEEDQQRRIHAVKGGLLTLERSLSREIVGLPRPQAEAIIKAKVHDLLEGYASGWNGSGELPGSSEKRGVSCEREGDEVRTGDARGVAE